MNSLLMLGLGFLTAGAELRLPVAVEGPFVQASRWSSVGQHAQADSVARAQTWAQKPEGLLLRSVVALGNFADRHDPASLKAAKTWLGQAETALEGRKEPLSRWMLALVLSQQSWVASLEGRNLAAALDGRKAANLCEALIDEGWDSPDLRGILGGYWFWKAQSLGALRVAMGGDTRAKGLTWTAQAAASGSPFREAYRTSLLWMRFERKEWTLALQQAKDGLAASPGNRLYRQALGDVFFRMGKYPDALEAYRTSWLEYRGIEVLPVNRISAAGNLARIHGAAGNADSARYWLGVYDDPKQKAVRPWLPPSLVREMEPVRARWGSVKN